MTKTYEPLTDEELEHWYIVLQAMTKAELKAVLRRALLELRDRRQRRCETCRFFGEAVCDTLSDWYCADWEARDDPRD